MKAPAVSAHNERVFWLSTALALTWWVSDPESATEVEGALQELWPEAPVEVVVGTPDGPGVWVDEDQLVLLSEGTTRHADAGDVWTQVVLVRSWAREHELDSAPDSVSIQLLPASTAPTAPPPRVEFGFAMGPGLLSPTINPPVHLAVESRRAGGVVGVLFGGDIGEVQKNYAYTAGVATQRLTVGLPLVWRTPLGSGTFEPALTPSARLILRNHKLGPEEDAWAAPALAARMRWYGEPAGKLTIGVGVQVTQDWPAPHPLGGQSLAMNFTTVHLEFCVIRGFSA